jgi:hypothetical protein
MSRSTRIDSAQVALLGAAASLTAVGGLWYATLMRGLWAAEALGPICRHGGLLAVHCPACYAALAMAAAGVVLGGLAARGLPLAAID